MEIAYTEEKKFNQDQVEALFRSVGWISADYPSRVYKALMHSETVITAWDSDRLIGLARAIDDSELVAFMHYVVVDPEYHGRGIAGVMVNMIKNKYKDFLYIELMPDESRNAVFYKRFGFRRMADGVPMQLCNFDDKR